MNTATLRQMDACIDQVAFSHPSHIEPVAARLAAHFPADDLFYTAIYELLANAVEHGNLGIGFETKGRLLREGTLAQEINNRLADPAHRHKCVHAATTLYHDRCELRITDSGAGFDWQHYRCQAHKPFGAHGRGLFIAFHAPFDALFFNASGNAVTCVTYY